MAEIFVFIWLPVNMHASIHPQLGAYEFSRVGAIMYISILIYVNVASRVINKFKFSDAHFQEWQDIHLLHQNILTFGRKR